ncbi:MULTISPECIES: Vga family ABC-F type ribosomal protection protein [Bacillaceae]|uniref:ABC-F type ribosomal protection protein n=1 Tax=Evansella alkalicola TaxID=745819 RepID=A0ABS6JW72_9BACI|nr:MULTISPECIES: ABC-F type ribosomal protection protein [Bacillaceae]MBU9722809.1 ABC-F type ribosomal protection protein [Bacillus alkalicola]
MVLLEAFQLKQFVKDRMLFDIPELLIHKGDRIGLVGANGSGKTTLLNILAGKLTPEKGSVTPHVQIELLPQLKRTDSTKSGGEVTQEYINQAFINDRGILFADEPTTHLDTEHMEWLEKKLDQWQGAYVIVSHDRAFLDATIKTIWEMADEKIKFYKGNYTDFLEQKEREINHQKAEYEKYESKKKQLEDALKLKEQKAEKATKKPKKVSKSEARITGAKPYFAKKQKKLQKTGKAIEKRLEQLEKVEKVKEGPSVKMAVPNQELIKNRIILRVEKVEGKIGNGKRNLWNKTSFYVRGGDKLAIIGPNGSGKTTLLKKILNQDEPGITISPSVKIGYFSQNLSILDVEKTILENVSSTSKQEESFIRTVLARLHFFREDVYKLVGTLSGGERVKGALAKVFVSDINMLILDEPTNYLDIQAASALESLLKEYEGTLLFVSHDRRLIESIATRVLTINDGKIEVFEGTYHDYKNKPVETRTRDSKEDELLVIQTKISDVLSRLSLEPSEELENEFQSLLKAKKALTDGDSSQ